MSVILDLLGDSVLDRHGRKVDPSNLFQDGKVIGLYFSASWCSPCRMFTNQLLAFYKHVTSTRSDVSFEVIFLSSDEDEEDFKEYFEKMPWLAVDFLHRETEAKLSQHFQVAGIPTLILLDGASGEVITDHGRAMVVENPKGTNFPWSTKEK